MDRRRFVGSLASSLSLAAGCVAAPELGRSDPDTTTSREPGLQATVTLAGQDATPDDLELSIDVEMRETAVTDDHPARFRITTTNHGRRRTITPAQDGCSLFNRRDSGSDEPRGLWLYRPGEAESLPRQGDRWAREQSAEAGGYPDYGCAGHEYARGESVENEYVVWDDPSVYGYLLPNTYRFEQPVEVFELGNPADRERLAKFTWGFSLRVSAS